MRSFVRPRYVILLLVLFCLTGVVGTVEASDGMRGDQCVVRTNEYITEDFYFFCRTLTVRGTIDGDLIGIAVEVTVERTGTVTGDLWVGGGRLKVEGMVGDDMHFVGIASAVESRARFTNTRIDLVSAALNTTIKKDAVLPGDLLVYGYQAEIDGTVGGDVDFMGEALLIDGVVSGRIDAAVGDARRSAQFPDLPGVSFDDPGLVIGDQAYIGGDLVYESRTASRIPPDAVHGAVSYRETESQLDITKVGRAEQAAEILRIYFSETLRDMVTLLLVGGVLLAFAPGAVRQPAQHVRRRIVPTVGWGLVTFMLSIPAVIVVLFFGLIMVSILYYIQLNALTMMIGGGVLMITAVLAGIFGFLLFFMGRVVISFVIGQMIDRYLLPLEVRGSNLRRWAVTLIVGGLVFSLLANIPLPAIGVIVEMLSALAGIGAVVMYFRDVLYASNLLGTGSSSVVAPLVVAHSPPRITPIVQEVELSPGMANLPEGFSGFDENW